MAAGVIPGRRTPRPPRPARRWPASSIQRAPSLSIALLSGPRAIGSPLPRDARSRLHLAKGRNHIPSRSPDADHNGEAGMGEIRQGGLQSQAEPQCAQRAQGTHGPRRLSCPTAPHRRSLAAQGELRASAGHCGGPSRPLAPSPGLAAGPGRPSIPEGEAPPPRPAPPGAPLGQRPHYRPLRPGASPARTPPAPRPAAPPPRAVPSSGRLRSVNRRPPYLSRAADRRADGPGQQAPRRAGAWAARHRRSSARAAAAASSRAPLGNPITQRTSPASRAAAAGRRERRDRDTKTGRRWRWRRRRRRRAERGSDSRWRLPGPPPSDCPASVLAKLRPQSPARDTAPSPAAARHLGPPRRLRLTWASTNRRESRRCEAVGEAETAGRPLVARKQERVRGCEDAGWAKAAPTVPSQVTPEGRQSAGAAPC